MAREKLTEVANEVQPVSPFSRLFLSPELNSSIIITMGFKSRGNLDATIEGLKRTLIKHPRFSSKLVIDHENKGKPIWVQTEVIVEDHVIVPDVDRDMEDPDQFLEDYLSNLTALPMDMFKPLWEIHLLDIKTSDAECVAVIKIHHSLGDGTSLMSLMLACTRKSSDPEALPTLPIKQKRVDHSNTSSRSILCAWRRLVVGFLFAINTCIDLFKLLATICFLRDTETPITAKKPDVIVKPKKLVHQMFSLDDIKLVKNSMKVSVNDVLLGIAQASISRYLNRKYNEAATRKSKKFLEGIRLRAAVFFNLRPSKGIEALADMMAKGSRCRWGNRIGYVLLPFSIGFEDKPPLEYVRRAKATMDRKKLSLESVFTYAILKFAMTVFGFKAVAALTGRIFGNTTLTFSNVVGPNEEVSIFGHPISYMFPGALGSPQALVLHFQSYANKMMLCMTVDPTIIQDPHKMRDDFVETLQMIKSAVLEGESHC